MADEIKETQTPDAELFKDLGINPNELPEDLQKIYKSMQADYTRKTQALADERKGYSTKEQDFMQRLQNYGALEQEVTQWREWYKSLEDQTADEDKQALLAKEEELREKLVKGEPSANVEMIHKLEAKIGELEGKLTGYEKAIGDVSNRTTRMLNYQAQLTELAGKHPKIDKNKLLDHALKIGQTDLEKAYQDLYRDDIIAEEVEKRLQEELAKRRTDGIHTSSRPVVVKRSEGPATWEGATEAIIKERAVQGKLEY